MDVHKTGISHFFLQLVLYGLDEPRKNRKSSGAAAATQGQGEPQTGFNSIGARCRGKVAEEVVQHLTGLLGSKVEVVFEIQADFSDGVPDGIVRTITENCRTLRFENFEFEKE
jgi:hypothetical protein